MIRYICELCQGTSDGVLPAEWQTYTTTVSGGQAADPMQPMQPPVTVHVCPSHPAVEVKIVPAA